MEPPHDESKNLVRIVLNGTEVDNHTIELMIPEHELEVFEKAEKVDIEFVKRIIMTEERSLIPNAKITLKKV